MASASSLEASLDGAALKTPNAGYKKPSVEDSQNAPEKTSNGSYDPSLHPEATALYPQPSFYSVTIPHRPYPLTSTNDT